MLDHTFHFLWSRAEIFKPKVFFFYCDITSGENLRNPGFLDVILGVLLDVFELINTKSKISKTENPGIHEQQQSTLLDSETATLSVDY